MLGSPVAELFRIEKSRDWSEIRASVQRLREIVPPTEDSLRRAFEAWLGKVILPRLGVPEEEAAPTAPTLDEFDTMLAERIDRWNREVHEAGRLEGKVEGEAGILLRLLRSKFGALNAGVEARVRSAEADQLLEWAGRVASERLEDVFRSA